MIEEGNVRLVWSDAEIRLNRPSRALRPGDRLILVLGHHRFDVAVEALGERRGPAPEARTLYRLVESGAPSGGERPAHREPIRRVETSID